MLQPILHRIILKLDDIEKKTESGIILAVDEKRERKAVEVGTVVSVGPTSFKDYGETPDIVKVGDRVYIAQYSGKTIKDTDGVEYTVVNDEDLICILQEDKDE